MKKVVVCYKWLLDDADIRVKGSRELDFEKAKYKINEYDRNGIMEGVKLKGADNAELIGVTCGPKTADSAKDALARGLGSVTYLDHADLDNRATAKTLAAMIKTIGDVDVVICSESSSDEFAQQVPARLAATLGIPFVGYASKVEAAGDALKITRKMDDGIENVEVPLPAVIGVLAEETPPIPSMKQILGAKKKPANKVDLAGIGLSDGDVAPQMTTVSVLAPEVKRKTMHLNAGGKSLADAAAELKKHLEQDGVL